MTTLSAEILQTDGLISYFDGDGVDTQSNSESLIYTTRESVENITKVTDTYSFKTLGSSIYVKLQNAPTTIKSIEFFFFSPANPVKNWVGLIGIDVNEAVSTVATGWFLDERDDGQNGIIGYSNGTYEHSEPWDDYGCELTLPHHFLITENEAGDGLELYKDGVIVSTLNKPKIVSSTGKSLFFGSVYHLGTVYSGEITYVNNIALYDRRLTPSEILKRVDYRYDKYEPKFMGRITGGKPTWANQETRSQAIQYPPQVQHVQQQNEIKLLGKTGGFNTTLDQQGNPRKMGYIASTVTLSDIPSEKRRVLLYSQSGAFLAETLSDATGNYRFDHLLMNQKYMTVAQYGSSDGVTPPDYLATAADFLTPTAYV